jgi:hypothetical protein
MRRSVRVGSVRGVPLFVHWSMPLGFLASMLILPLWIAFIVTTIFHEAGHAVMVRLNRGYVTAFELRALGGRVDFEGVSGEAQRAAIAWGGILGQLVLCGGWAIAWLVTNPVQHENLRAWAEMFLVVNVAIGALNLLPIAPLDGAQAWLLFRPSRIVRRFRLAKLARLQRELDELEQRTTPPKKSDLPN